jgi:hypothetical protein
VWVAFLHYDHDDDAYRLRHGDRTLTNVDSYVNWAATLLDRSSIFHSQLLFWNARARRFVTFSTNWSKGHAYDEPHEPTFPRGWTFVRLVVDAHAERLMYDFVADAARRRVPYSTVAAAAVLVRPIDNRGATYFCSELIVAALHRAGFLRGVRAHATSPAALRTVLLHERAHEFDGGTHETENPVLE